MNTRQNSLDWNTFTHTRTSWSQLGGLPGLTLSVQDSGVPHLTLHEAPGLDEIFQGMRRFVVLKDLKVETVDSSKGEVYEDNVLAVRARVSDAKNLHQKLCPKRNYKLKQMRLTITPMKMEI
ncbi:ELAC2 family protein [Megaselia abdita]